MTTATLGFAIQSDTAVAAKERLDQMSGASKRAESATNALNAASRQSSTGARSLAQATNMVAAAQTKAATATKATTMAYKAQSSAMGAVAARSRNLSFQLIDIGQALATAPTMGIYALQNLGFQVAQIGQLYMGQGGFNQAIKDSARQVGAFASRLGPLAAAAAALGIGFAAATHEINRTSDAAVSMGDVMVAAVQVSWEAIINQLQPALNKLADWWDRFTPRLMANLKDYANGIIAAFVGPYDAVVAVWDQLPAVFTDLGYQAAQGMLDAFAGMARGAANIFNDMTLGIQKQFQKLGVYLDVPTVDAAIYAPQLNNPAAGAASNAASVATDALRNAFETDYTGEFFGRIADRARELASATDEVGKAAGRAADPWKGLRKATEQASEAFKFARDTTKGFLSDLYSGLKSGEGFWKSFANAASNAIDKIVDKLLGNLVDALFQVNSAGQSIGGGGGGILGAAISGLGAIFGFANGGYTGNGGRNQPAGIVHGGEYVFSKAATDRLGVPARPLLYTGRTWRPCSIRPASRPAPSPDSPPLHRSFSPRSARCRGPG